MRKFFYVFLLAISAANVSFSDEVTAKAQRLLNELGYDAGPVDGLMGTKTRNAISEAFQAIGKPWDQELMNMI